jgi:hypothetical protein
MSLSLSSSRALAGELLCLDIIGLLYHFGALVVGEFLY